MSLKRGRSFTQSDTQATELVSYEPTMSTTARPYKKTRRGTARSAGKMRLYRAPSARPQKWASFNKTMVATTVDYDVEFTADVSHGFGFSPTHLWVNGVSSTAYVDAAGWQSMFDLIRVHKVEVTILPGNNYLGYGTNTLSTGQRNIPYGYFATDLNSGGNPSLNGIRERSDCETFSLDKVFKRTIYPRLFASDYVTDVGANRSNLFVPVSADVPWYGALLYLDLKSVALTYDVCRISFKVFVELSSSR